MKGLHQQALVLFVGDTRSMIKKIKEVIEDKQIDINNHKDSYMIIQEFMKHHIDGVKLKEGKVTKCPSCSTDNLR